MLTQRLVQVRQWVLGVAEKLVLQYWNQNHFDVLHGLDVHVHDEHCSHGPHHDVLRDGAHLHVHGHDHGDVQCHLEEGIYYPGSHLIQKL